MSVDTVAIHEAGHAVCCFVQRIPVIRVCLESQGNGSLSGFQRGSGLSQVHSFVRICLAGFVAERIAIPNCIPSSHGQGLAGHGQDLADARCVLFQVYGDKTLCEQQLQALYVQCVHMLSVATHWQGVERLAELLLERESLSGAEAQRLIGEAQNASNVLELNSLQDRLLVLREEMLTQGVA